MKESGANSKEAQELVRHAMPGLTMNTYTRATKERLSEVVADFGTNSNGTHGRMTGT